MYCSTLCWWFDNKKINWRFSLKILEDFSPISEGNKKIRQHFCLCHKFLQATYCTTDPPHTRHNVSGQCTRNITAELLLLFHRTNWSYNIIPVLFHLVVFDLDHLLRVLGNVLVPRLLLDDVSFNLANLQEVQAQVGPVRRNVVCTGRFIQSGKQENKKIRIVHTQYSGVRKSGRSGEISSVLGGLYRRGG